LDKFQELSEKLNGVEGEFAQLARVVCGLTAFTHWQYALLPQYTSKLRRLQSEMQDVTEKSQELKERAVEVQIMKSKTMAADAHLLAKPANSQRR
jgi:hypothetical protein